MAGRPDDVVDDAEHLVATLPPGDGYRRVQLACWAAHQLLLRGDRWRADRLLDIADGDPYGASERAGPGPGDPGAGRHAGRRRRRRRRAGRSTNCNGYAVARSDVTAEAAALLLGARPGVGGRHARRRDRGARRHRRASASACPDRTSGGGRRRSTRRSSSRPDGSTRRRRRSRRRRGSGRELRVEAAAADGAGPAAHAAVPRRDRSAASPRRSPTSWPGPMPRRRARRVRAGVRRGRRHGERRSPSPAGSPPSRNCSPAPARAGRSSRCAPAEVAVGGGRPAVGPGAAWAARAVRGHRPGVALRRVLRDRRTAASASWPWRSATGRRRRGCSTAAVEQERRRGASGLGAADGGRSVGGRAAR